MRVASASWGIVSGRPSAAATTDTFAATLEAGGVMTHTFTIAAPGTMRIGVDDLTTAGLVVGLGLGDWDAATAICTLQLSSATARRGDVFEAIASQAGDYCVQIVDAGTVQWPVDYPLRVTHP